ncbi:MAG: calcineurin-like phosphoesterase family protein [Alistipes sp.]
MMNLINKMLFFLFATTVVCGCSDSDGEESSGEVAPAGTDTYGYVTDSAGKPLEGIVVSDGYTCVATDATGLYSFSRNAAAYYVFYSLPAAYEVKISKLTGLPEFYAKLQRDRSRYDFMLTSLATAETQFDLFCIGDPQVNDMEQVARFRSETVRDINAYGKTGTTPRYAIALGDLVNNKWNMIPNMVSAMQQPKMGMPVFQTIGNHDHDYNASDNLAAQRTYESYCGPTNYSFDRGNVHIVSMDNVIHGCAASDAYEGGLLEWQYKWLEQDLNYVAKDKMVIFCVHIPFRNGATSGGNSMNTDKYYNEVLALLSQYASATILSAHTHSNQNYIHTVNGKEIYEHVTGTTCGAWWRSTVCTEGTPNGYGVYHINGAAITDWLYKAVNYEDTYQIRLYRGTDKFNGGKSTYTFTKRAEGQIIANVWNADPAWKVNVYENGVKTGTMTAYADHDAWTVAYHVGAQGGSDSYDKKTDHLYYYTLQNPTATVRVEAVDRFGHTYTQTKFTDPLSTPATY